ncbi:MAG: Wzz/FepE/Etk N-terminal domain-containing protein [Cyclobacteriaceae bacterium]
MDLLFLGKVLWRKLWILVSVPLIAAFAAFLFTLDATDTYVSRAQLATGFTIQDQVQLTEEKFNSREADIKFSNLMSSMNSGLAVNLTSYRLLLHDLDPKQVPFHRPDPEQFTTTPQEIENVRNALITKLRTFSPLSSADPEYLLVSKFFSAYGYAYNDVKDNLSIERMPNTDYIDVYMAADRPSLAALAANAFCEEFIRYNQSRKSERSNESVDFLKQLSDAKRGELDKKLEIQKMFKANNNVFNIEGESGMKMGQLSVLETQAASIRSNIHRLELNIRSLRDDIRKLNAPVTSNSNQRILELRTQINNLNERYITGGSTNRSQLDSLNFLREELRIAQDNSYRQGASVTPGYTASDLQIKLREAEIDLDVQKTDLGMTQSKIRAINYSFSGYANKEAQLSAIQKEVDLANQEYTMALEKYNEAKNRQLTSNDLRQVLVAAPPVNPEPSTRFIIVGLAAFTSLFLSLLAVVGLELMDGAIRTPEKFKRMVNLPIAGILNRIDSRNFNIRTYFNQQNGNDETEMFKSLLRKFRHEIESLNGKVILFTSPNKRDGKTFVMFSLSYVLSLLDKRVLIVDTNFKNNSLSQILGRGQSDLKVLDSKKNKLLVSAQGEKKEEQEFAHENSYELINPTKYKNIYIVGNSGGGNESPAEILSGRDFTNLVSMLSDSFDYVLMEGASLNDYSDTKELVKYADKVVAVFSAESSIRQFDRESIQYFKSLGKKFGGCVLNRVDTKDLKL